MKAVKNSTKPHQSTGEPKLSLIQTIGNKHQEMIKITTLRMLNSKAMIISYPKNPERTENPGWE